MCDESKFQNLPFGQMRMELIEQPSDRLGSALDTLTAALNAYTKATVIMADSFAKLVNTQSFSIKK